MNAVYWQTGYSLIRADSHTRWPQIIIQGGIRLKICCFRHLWMVAHGRHHNHGHACKTRQRKQTWRRHSPAGAFTPLALRHRKYRAGRPFVYRFSCRRRPDILADSSPGSDKPGFWKFPLHELFIPCRQPTLYQPGAASGTIPAQDHGDRRQRIFRIPG